MAGVTAVWTGAKDNLWTNAANWLVEGEVPERCPGVVSNAVDGVFVPDLPSGDIAEFGGSCANGRATIDLSGLYSISRVVVTGENAPKYTFGTDAASQCLPFETNGVFTVDASVPPANCPTVNAAVVLPANISSAFFGKKANGDRVTDGKDMITINNNGAGTLVFNGDFTGPWFRPDGTREYMEVRVVINSEAGGTLRFCGSQTTVSYLYSYVYNMNGRMEHYGDWVKQKTITLSGGPEIYLAEGAVFGPYVGNNTGVRMNDNNVVNVTGDGVFQFTENMTGSSFDNHGPSDFGRGEFALRTKFVVKKNASQSASPRILMKTTQTYGGRLFLDSPEPCDIPGGILMTGRSNLKISSTNQLSMCPKIETDARTTTVKPYTDIEYATNVVIWAGAATETFETPVTFQGNGPRRVTLRNSGSAALTAGMTVTVEGEGGNVSIGLDGDTAPVVYGMNLEAGMPVAVTGDVVMPDGADFGNVSGFLLEGGRLQFENSAEISAPSVSVVSGKNSISVKDENVKLSVSHTAGTLDILREGDATIVCEALAGQSPGWLTVNGVPAALDGEGRVLVATIPHDVAISARGDAVPHDPEKVVGITTEGSGGNDTLASDDTEVKGLVHKAMVPAVVAVADGQTLAAGIVSVADGAGPLTIGDVAGRGSLVGGSEGISLENRAFGGVLTVNAKVSSGEGVIDVTGNGTVLAGGTAGPSALKVHDGILTLSGETPFELSDLLVATNAVDTESTLLLENADDVTYEGTAERLAAVVGGGAASSGANSISRLVISNSTFRCDKPGCVEYYERDSYTNNVFMVGYNGSGILEVMDGGVFKGRLAVGGIMEDTRCYGSGAVYQHGGHVSVYGKSWKNYRASSYLGGDSSSAAYYELNGGELVARGCFVIGTMNGSIGTFHQYGGLFCLSNILNEAGEPQGEGHLVLGASNKAMGHMYVRDGKCDFSGNVVFNDTYSGGAQSFIAISGEKAFVDCHAKTIVANRNGWNQYVLEAGVSIADGARLRAGGFRNDSYYGSDGRFDNPSNHFFHVWFDGGILETGGKNVDLATPGAQYEDLHKYGMTGFLVGPGGATVDTAGKAGNFSRKPFSSPTNGVVAAIKGFVPCETPVIYSRKMVGAPAVCISGDGVGACAIAQFDSATRMVTNVIVTSGGTGYTWARADFYYWRGSGISHASFDCEVSEPSSGSFTKAGEGDFTFMARNTYGGETVLEGGVLRLGVAGALPDDTVVVYAGGTLESTAAAFPETLKVSIPGADDASVRRYTLATFTDGCPDALPCVEVVNAAGGKKALWHALFSGETLRVVRQSGTVISVR